MTFFWTPNHFPFIYPEDQPRGRAADFLLPLPCVSLQEERGHKRARAVLSTGGEVSGEGGGSHPTPHTSLLLSLLSSFQVVSGRTFLCQHISKGLRVQLRPDFPLNSPGCGPEHFLNGQLPWVGERLCVGGRSSVHVEIPQLRMLKALWTCCSSGKKPGRTRDTSRGRGVFSTTLN